MLVRSRNKITAALICLLLVSCSKKKDDESDTDAIDPTTPGVTASSNEKEMIMAGSLALSLGLVDTAPDKVIAFMASAGEFRSLSDTVQADIDTNGQFSLTLPKVSPLIDIIEAAKKADGTYDRAAISEAINETIDESVTDEQISQYAEELKKRGQNGGVTFVLVTKVSSSDRFEEAKSFKFIGVGAGGDQVINGMPISAVKGNISLGTISGDGEQIKSALEANSDVFDLSTEVIANLASTSNALKTVRNLWANTNRDTGESYTPTPFFLWNSGTAAIKNAFSEPTGPSYAGYGMYISVNKGAFTFGEICHGTKALTLVPPESIDAGDNYGTISADRPFNNSGLTSINSESTRSNCGGSDTGFYAAGETEDDTDLNINWGAGGSLQGNIPAGYFDMKLDGTHLASFELASSSPIDGNGNPKVFIPAVKVSTDDSGVITAVEAKLYVWNSATSAFEEVTDPKAFLMGASTFQVEIVKRDNSNTTDERYSLLDGLGDNGVFKVEASAMERTWKFPGSADSNDATTATEFAVYYEMYNSSYRFEFRTYYD